MAAEVGAAEDTGSQAVSPEQANAFVAMVMRLSWIWTIAMVALAIISTIHIGRSSSGGNLVHFGVGTATLAAIALIWLPAVVRLLSLTGGGFKAFGFEASTGGLAAAPEALIAGLARIRTEVTEVERATPAAADRTQNVLVEVDRIATEYLGGTAAAASDALAALARRYESIRAEPRSRDRTVKMNLLLNEARVRARASPGLAAQTGRELLSSNADGDRVIGLALLQQEPTADALPELLRVLTSSRSAFEQYHASVAIENVAPVLSTEQCQTAIDVLQREQTDPRGVGLNQDAFIPAAMNSALHALGTT